MLVAEKRPRNLTWLHAGPLLFGDWGTSRLYVLGLAFFFTAHASAVYLGAMSVIMAAVAWGYTVVCRCFPDGGGVYASARRLSVPLSVIGATLLLCDYIVTATLSAVEAFHYFGVGEKWVEPLTVIALVVIGVINWFGARRAGQFALIIATLSLGVSATIGVLCLPYLKEGLQHLEWSAPGQGGVWDRWHSLVAIMLALSGVEAVSNMTSLMKEPVASTAKKTLWPVLIEVVVFNLIFGIAISGLPQLVGVHEPHFHTQAAPLLESGVSAGALDSHLPAATVQYRDTAVKLLASASGQHWFGESAGVLFGRGAAIIFGLLLLSASNTAIMAIVSVLYAMGQDGEVPRRFTRLNYSGVPSTGLIVATAAPILLLLIVGSSVQLLAELYAVGVVGAIAINLLCCAYNRGLSMRAVERGGLWAVGGFMLLVECTIVVDKWRAGLFAGLMVGAVMISRAFLHAAQRRAPQGLAAPAHGWLEELQSITKVPVAASPRRVMLAARGRDQAEFAVDLARREHATLFVIFVRTLRLVDVEPNKVPRLESDRDAQEALGSVVHMARAAGVGVFPIYVTSADVAAEILDYTVTFGCDTLIMGKSRRDVLSRTLAGDVVAEVAAQLPEGVTLLTRAPGAFQPVEQVVVVEPAEPGEKP